MDGYITFLTDINMWMGYGAGAKWLTIPEWPGDSKNFMKNLLRRSVDNIEAVSKTIIKLFKQMRQYITDNQLVFQRLDRIEVKQLKADKNFKVIFQKLEEPRVKLLNSR